MINYFLYAGKSSRDFALFISGDGTYDAPERDYEFLDVPGRSGSLVVDNKRFKNVTLKYPAFISRNFPDGFEAFRNYMLSLTGYQRLEDTYHPDEFRKALFKGPLEPDVSAFLRDGQFDIEFECMPQRFLKSGEKTYTFTKAGTITNPTYYESKPVIRCYGAGKLGVGSSYITVASHPFDYIDIDCDVMDAYCGSSNANSYITLSGTDFPTLPAGQTGISIGKLTKVEIIPRWWRI